MKKALILALLVFISISQVFSQKTTKIIVSEKIGNQKPTVVEANSPTKFSIKESIFDLTAITKPTKDGSYIEIVGDGLMKTYNAGNPDLPVITKLIEIPANQTVKINIVSFKEKQIKLADYNIKEQIIPAQESVSKSDDPAKIDFKKNKEIYTKNSFYQPEFVTFEDEGYLRNKHLGFIQISPFEYNPVTNILNVKYDFEVEIEFVSDNKSSIIIDERLQSPYFENLTIQTINSTADTKALIQGPVKYVIVSHEMFQATLQPFIEWKKMKGFLVVEAYTNNPAVGTTTTSIKNYLQGLYDTPSDGTAPTFVLLVGDVAQIPAFSGTSGSHVTDLYYYDYTNDNKPDVFGGRFSAATIDQLQSQIDKTLQVEKYLMPDASYLNNVVLIAGVDPSYAPTYGNGFVNYANNNYINSTNGLNSLSYLYPASGSADETIRANISAGVALANYTAHCSSSGWADPTFSTSHISAMTNTDMYPLMIGNCCLSLTFGGDCFGEEIVRAANKGAVGYIGASNNTYWDEDYFWGIGKRTSITADPTYDAANLGAYDRFFHSHDEAKDNWYITQGQINVAGNLAVESSSSSRKLYYWEIYHLMGDPSLTPFVKEPSALIANFNSEIIIGASSFEVSTEEDAFVAISLNGILLDAKISGADGLVNLAFSPLTEVDIAKLVITKQNRIPKIVDISIIPSTTPYVIKENITINDEVGGNNNGVIDYGEQIKLSITLKNVSDTYDALSVEAKLYCADTNIKIIDSLENFGTILKDTVSLKNNSYLFQVKDSIIDQHSFQLTFLVTGNDSDGNPYTWTSKESLIINAPKLELGDLIVDDSEFNGNGILDPGETATLKQLVKNIGHAGISGLTGLIEYVSGSTLFTIDQSTTSAFELAAGSTDTISFIVTASASELIGTAVELKITIVDNTIDFYTISGNETIIIGEIPEYNISAGGKIPVFNTTLFYDSGGPAANYGDRENYKITFVPKQETGYLKVTFNSFDVELNSSGGCYDKLFIYNDTTNNEAKKIGEFCSNNPPTEFEANNASGALTFVFTSDASVVKTGWEAEINFVQNNAVTFIVSASGNPIENALISFNNQEKYTNSTGEAIFDNIRPNSQLNYEIRKIGYENESGTINVTSDIVKTVELTVGIPNYTVKFNVIDGSTAINGASITFDGLTRVTATDGSCTFDSVEYGLNKKYTITKDKYYQYTDSVDVDSNLVENVSMTLITFNITFLVTSNENSGPLEDVIVAFNSENKITNSEGIAIFNNVSPKSGIAYSLTKTGYTTITGTLDVANENKSVSFAMSVVSSVNDIMPGEVSVFPNPSQGIINIRFEERKENIQINVYDVIGKSVFTKTLPQIENIEIIDLTNQPKGLYFVSIKSGDGEVISKKILIK